MLPDVLCMQQRIQAVIKASRREGQAMSVLSCVVFVPLFPSIGKLTVSLLQVV